MTKQIFIVLFQLLFWIPCRAQQADKWINEGNTHYKAGRFEKAAELYNKALESDPGNLAARYNLASATYKQEQRDDAAGMFSDIAGKAKEAPIRAKAWYNQGVALSRQKKLEESIEAYKRALRQDPGDMQARENLQKALLELKKKPPPKKQQEKENKKKQQQQQQKKQQSGMSPKEAEQRLKLLQQKEKEVLQRMQKEKSTTGGGATKDW